MNLEEWLKLSRSELATLVEQKAVTVLISLDGTQRHYLLQHPELDGRIEDFGAYAKESGDAYANVFRLFFDLGVKALLVPLLIENDFWRGDKYINQAVQWSSRMLLNPPFTDVYNEYDTQARLYGDYRFAQSAKTVRNALEQISQQLINTTIISARQIWFGYMAGSLADDLVERSIGLFRQLGRIPTEAELRANEFGADGPGRVNILINSGWLIHGGVVPAIFANQAIDIYNLPYLAFDLTDTALRKILYDHIYLRHAAAYDMTMYSATELMKIKEFYDVHQNCIIGFGQNIGPALWYADHNHE